jgi:hypothetical protein
MSEQKLAKPQKAPKLDRWGLAPVLKGHVRGRAKNIRSSERVSSYGHIHVVDFDLWVDEGLPLVAVRMLGTDFQGRVLEDQLYDVPDATPDVRPIEAWNIRASHDPEQGVIAYQPGREFAVKQRGLGWTILTVVAPVAVTAGIALFLVLHFGWIH